MQNFTPEKDGIGIEMKSEIHRLRTFANYLSTANKSAIMFAAEGYIYIGNGKTDKVRCYFCGKSKENWQIDDDIKDIHYFLSPNCPMVIGEECDNIPLIPATMHLQSTRVTSSNVFSDNGRTDPTASLTNRNERRISKTHLAFSNAPSNGRTESVTSMISRKGGPESTTPVTTSNGRTESTTSMISTNGGPESTTPVTNSNAPSNGTSEPTISLTNRNSKRGFIRRGTSSDGPNSDINETKTPQTPSTTTSLCEPELTTPITPRRTTEEFVNTFSCADFQKLKKETNELHERTLCKICFDNYIEILFLPCGHLVTCTDCAAALIKCPICRRDDQGRVRVFFEYTIKRQWL